MKRTFIPLYFLFYSWLFLSFLVVPALAHGEQPRLELGTQAASPGSVLQIRGVGFEFEALITLELVGTSDPLAVGSVTADEEGGFELNYIVPADLAEGSYLIQATTDDYQVMSPEFAVRGPVVEQEAAETVRGEEDTLLLPMPTLPVGYNSTPLPHLRMAGEHPPQEEPALQPGMVLPVLGLLAAGLMLVAARLWRARQ